MVWCIDTLLKCKGWCAAWSVSLRGNPCINAAQPCLAITFPDPLHLHVMRLHLNEEVGLNGEMEAGLGI